MNQEFQQVDYSVVDGVATIAQNRPERRNAQSAQMLDELDDALHRAVKDPNVRVIVYTGVGEHFSAGHDLKEGQEVRQDFTPEERWDYETEKYIGYCLNIRNAPKPTIARVDGACIAGAFMMANMCDIIVASNRAFFADPVLHTMAVASVEVLVHPWVMGSRQARDFLYLGERMSAQDAHRVGMVNRVVDASELDETVATMADRIKQAPSFAIEVLKRSLNRTDDIRGFTNALNAHFDGHMLTHFSAEATRGKDDGGFSNVITRNKTKESVR